MTCCKCCCVELWYIDQRVSILVDCDLSGAGLTFSDFDGQQYHWYFSDGPFDSPEEAEQASFGPGICDPFQLCAYLQANCGYAECDPYTGRNDAVCTYIGPTCECRNQDSAPP